MPEWMKEAQTRKRSAIETVTKESPSSRLAFSSSTACNIEKKWIPRTSARRVRQEVGLYPVRRQRERAERYCRRYLWTVGCYSRVSSDNRALDDEGPSSRSQDRVHRAAR